MPSQYNPEIHHRRSIRLKGHDYAGGGLYFVTICTNRDAGNIFAPPDVREMVGRVWESVANATVGAGLVPAPLVPAPLVPVPPSCLPSCLLRAPTRDARTW